MNRCRFVSESNLRSICELIKYFAKYFQTILDLFFKMADKSLLDRFLTAVTGLNLKFPVAEISEKTGIGQPTVSVYMNGKRAISLSFLRKFCEVFELDYEQIKSGKMGGGASVPVTVDLLSGILEKQNELLEVLNSTMARQNSILERQANAIESKVEAVDKRTQLMATNLTEVLVGVEKISIRQDSALKEIHDNFSNLKSGKIPPSQDASKKVRGNGGDGEKQGKKR